MSNMQPNDKISMSFHLGMRNKNENNLDRSLGWKVGRATVSAIADHFKSGLSVCVATLNSSHREDANFLSSQFIGIDFDEGPSVKDLTEKDQFIRQYACIVMDTASSTPEAPRSRAFFKLDRPVTDGEEYKRLVVQLMGRFSGYKGIDPACKSCTQLFYGNDKATIWQQDVNIPVAIVSTLPQPKNLASALGQSSSDFEVSFEDERRPTKDILSQGSEPGSRDNDAIRLVSRYANILPPDEVETIMRLWYNNLPDTSDFPFSKIQDMVRRRSADSMDVLKKVETVVNAKIDEKKNGPKAPTQEALRRMSIPFFNFISEGIDTTWMIKDWLPAASTAIMVAPPSHFKTWIALSMAMSVGMGRPFLGRFPVTKMEPVLYMQLEDSASITRQRSSLIFGENCIFDDPVTVSDDGMIDTGIIIPKVNYYSTETTFKLDDPVAMKNLWALVADLKAKLLIIDPLYAASDSADFMAKDAQRLVEFKRMRDALGVTVMVLHHTKKSATPAQGPGSTKPNRLDIWGSQFLNAWLETGIQIRSAADPKTVSIMRHFKSEGNTFHDMFTFDINTDEDQGEKRFKVTSTKADETSGVKMDAVELFQRHGPMGVSDFAKRAGVAVSSASRKLAKLAEKGVLVKRPDQLYSLIDVDLD